MDLCDQLVLIVEPTLASITAARRWQSVFNELGYHERKVLVVINRAGGKVKLVERELASMSAFAGSARVPCAFELLQVASARGEAAIVSDARSPYSVAISKLRDVIAERLSNEQA